MKLSVIIVNYNVKYLLEQCLHSLQKALQGISSDIWVIDNASTDGSLAYLCPRFPEVNFIANPENSGFAHANNQAIRQAQGEYLLLLNPDTLVGENTLRQCLDFMEATPQAGGAGCRMLNPDGSFAFESRRGFPSPLTSFYKMTGLCSLFPYSRHFGKYYMRYLSEEKAHPIEVISGAFMFLRKKAIDKSGLLDEDFFMYGEDIDLSFRISRAGYQNYYIPAPILHYKGESTKKDSLRYVKIFYEAMLIFFRKHYPHSTVFLSFPIQTAIYLRASLAVGKRIGDKGKQLLGIEKKEFKPHFLVAGTSESILEIQEICRKNHLDEKHTYLSADEKNLPQELLKTEWKKEKYTHFVFDREVFSYSFIFGLLKSMPSHHLEIGTYSSQTKILITPRNNYQ